MAKRYNFVTDDDSEYIPVGDGGFVIDGMSSGYSTGQCYVQFYDNLKLPVTPTAGTVTFKSSAFPTDQWLESSNGIGLIQATTVEAGDSSYTVPQFDGCVISSEMTLSGITGASFVKAYHWRS